MCYIQLSNVIAIGAAIIACISVLFAYKSSTAANEIAKHNDRLLIYKALLRFRGVLVAKGENFSEESFWKFDDAVQLSEFFYKESSFKALVEIRENSFQVQNNIILYEITKKQGKEKYNNLREKTRNLCRKTRDQCTVASELLKKELKLDGK
ncbi:MAG: hypothetical protein L3J98_02725 [Gammaproteobacteria bacterium]|nr:hypothetical protein [Gammaproteobacteria bacterium]MCF6259069.1 hypothetical protein [Gammaproteobacteria bacterium]